MNPAQLTNEELIAATQEALKRGLFEPEPSTEEERAAQQHMSEDDGANDAL